MTDGAQITQDPRVTRWTEVIAGVALMTLLGMMIWAIQLLLAVKDSQADQAGDIKVLVAAQSYQKSDIDAMKAQISTITWQVANIERRQGEALNKR